MNIFIISFTILVQIEIPLSSIQLQQNLSKADTFGAKKPVRFRQMPALL